jgi:leader peptidase (prepilin peptidase)/N-methyltransferase
METAEVIEFVAVGLALVACVVSDLRWRVIPNRCVAVVMVARAACLVASRVGGASWVSSLLGAAEALAVLSVAVALSRVVFGTSGVGGGDVKLISALGLCFGAEWTPVLIMLTSAFVVATGLFLRGRRGSEESARLAVPAAPAITIAVVVTFSLAFRVKQL